MRLPRFWQSGYFVIGLKPQLRAAHYLPRLAERSVLTGGQDTSRQSDPLAGECPFLTRQDGPLTSLQGRWLTKPENRFHQATRSLPTQRYHRLDDADPGGLERNV
jgi:hypothetical protein